MLSDDVAAALQTYDLMSRKMFTHATPTLFNAGMHFTTDFYH